MEGGWPRGLNGKSKNEMPKERPALPWSLSLIAALDYQRLSNTRKIMRDTFICEGQRGNLVHFWDISIDRSAIHPNTMFPSPVNHEQTEMIRKITGSEPSTPRNSH